MRSIFAALRLVFRFVTSPVWLSYRLFRWLTEQVCEPSVQEDSGSSAPTAGPEAMEAAKATAALAEASAVRRIVRALLAADAPELADVKKIRPEVGGWLQVLSPSAMSAIAKAPSALIATHISGDTLLPGVPAVASESRKPSVEVDRLSAERSVAAAANRSTIHERKGAQSLAANKVRPVDLRVVATANPSDARWPLAPGIGWKSDAEWMTIAKRSRTADERIATVRALRMARGENVYEIDAPEESGSRLRG